MGSTISNVHKRRLDALKEIERLREEYKKKYGKLGTSGEAYDKIYEIVSEKYYFAVSTLQKYLNDKAGKRGYFEND